MALSPAAVAAADSLAVSAPRLLIAAAQPYQTVAGPALTVNFLRQSQLLPFQRLPFTYSAVAPFYFHALLHTLAEFAETPRPVRQSLVKQIHAPMDDFWRSVGTLNRFSCTVYEKNLMGVTKRGRVTDYSWTHPSMGAVELSRVSHRHECDVRLTLFREDFAPLAAMVMTGPDETMARETSCHPQHPPLRREGAFVPLQEPARRRRPLSFQPVPTDAAAFYRPRVERECVSALQPSPSSLFLEAERSLLFPTDLFPFTHAEEGKEEKEKEKERNWQRCCGGLYGPLVVMLHQSGYAHRAGFSAAPEPSPSAAAGEEAGIAGNGEGEPLDEEESAAAALPPWALHSLIADLCSRLDEEGHFLSEKGPRAEGRPSPSSSKSLPSPWWVCAFDCQQSGDALYGLPIDFVVAPPRVFASDYRVPPWRQQIGQPSLQVGEQGQESEPGTQSEKEKRRRETIALVALRLEARQKGRVFLDGTFYCRRGSSAAFC